MEGEIFIACQPLAGRTGHGAGRALLAALYRRVTGAAPPPIAVTDRGKPYFTAGAWQFSISHTPNRVFCALAERNVAVDAEELTRRVNLRLAEKILSPAEKVRFDAAGDQNRALLTLWVLKEAAVKLTGQGLRGYPNDTDFSPDDPRVRELAGCLVAIMADPPGCTLRIVNELWDEPL